MFKLSTAELFAFAGLFGAIAYCWAALVPSGGLALAMFGNPAYFALVGATVSAPVYLVVSAPALGFLVWRRLVLALFLAAMPLIYLWAALAAADRQAILVEAAGTLVFTFMAVAGYRRSLSILGAGIAAHGVAWDLWHHHHAAYIEPWYPAGCLVVDLAFFAVTVAQTSAGRSQAARESGVTG